MATEQCDQDKNGSLSFTELMSSGSLLLSGIQQDLQTSAKESRVNGRVTSHGGDREAARGAGDLEEMAQSIRLIPGFRELLQVGVVLQNGMAMQAIRQGSVDSDDKEVKAAKHRRVAGIGLEQDGEGGGVSKAIFISAVTDAIFSLTVDSTANPPLPDIKNVYPFHLLHCKKPLSASETVNLKRLARGMRSITKRDKSLVEATVTCYNDISSAIFDFMDVNGDGILRPKEIHKVCHSFFGEYKYISSLHLLLPLPLLLPCYHHHHHDHFVLSNISSIFLFVSPGHA